MSSAKVVCTSNNTQESVDKLFLGLDISTQQAIELLLDRMKHDGYDFSRVKALSGAAQQHGSVYWKHGAEKTLSNVDPSQSLLHQLKDSFSVQDSPIWMDASTSAQCRALEKAVGGPQKLADITGSRGYERLTGNQIAKLYTTHPDVYANTERISLVSSFGTSVFIGRYADIDMSDGSGMNLLDIRTLKWSPECLNACAEGLERRLGPPTDTIALPISPYFVQKYGFSPHCKVVTFTGDNPASLIAICIQPGTTSLQQSLLNLPVAIVDYIFNMGYPFAHTASLIAMCVQPGDAVVSLGTSDVLTALVDTPEPCLNGMVYVNPFDTTRFFLFSGFKNGSLTRERICKEMAGGSWDTFGQLLQSTPMGNGGNIGFYFDVVEIQPTVSGVYRFNEFDNLVPSFTPAIEVRAILESQFMLQLIYASALNLDTSKIKRILATGGASNNKAILQVLSDVFNVPVYVRDVPNSAALGGAYRAKRCSSGESYEETIKTATPPTLAATPTPGAFEAYQSMRTRCQYLVDQMTMLAG